MEIFEIYGQQETLTQWDVGRKIAIREACDYIHFANEAMEEAVAVAAVQIGDVWVADIPDYVLQAAGVLRVYAFVAGALERYTKRSQNLFVRAKPKPSNYIYTPAQVESWEVMTARVHALEQKQETDPTVPAWAKQAQKPAYNAQEVGAAPAGFGYRYAADTDQAFMAVIEECLAQMPSDSVRHVSIDMSGRHSVTIHKQVNGYASIEDVTYTIAWNTFYGKRVRSMYNSVWGEWELENAPMYPGVEYRTTERFHNKPVYVFILYGGALPNASVKIVTAPIQYTHIIDVSAFSTCDGGGYKLPMIHGVDTSGNVEFWQGGASAGVKTYLDDSYQDLYVTWKYTKD